jgi:alpha-mannosidase
MLLGQRFFRNEFGKTSKIMWMPDVFGYSGALPQLMKKSGLDYFMTIKLSWSKFNVFPHHTFSWQGIDGSKVLAHMPPEGTYNSSAAPRAIAATERNYLDKYVSENALLVYGIGDGGGGPGEEHLERLDREKNLDGLPPVTQEPAADFFERIAAEIDNYKTWSGELYLEYHQGTLTSQARNKRFNRKLELALRDLEWLAVAASAHAGYEYPQATLETIWKEMLLYQFHDILPGSSITRVYDESRARYQILLDQTQALYDQAATALISQIDTQGITTPVVALNTLSWDRAEWVHYDNIWMKLGVPAMGYLAAELTPSPVDGPVLSADPSSLENGDLRITFAADGSISSIYDKTNQREVIADGSAANVLTVYSDPGDAWDFAFDYAEKPSQRFSLVSAEPSIDGPQALLHQRWQFGDSTLSQRVILTAGSRRIDFVTEVDWQENAKMLRTSFPLSVRAALATCEIQFGTIQRPTHTNTSWDLAKYEIPAHKWVDLSQRDYGVALLNDCKYGYHVSENTLDLNLLRSPHFPDPVADRAVHQFTYALYPHAGDHVEGGVTRAGYELNVPLRLAKTDAHAGTLPATTSLLSVNAENVIVEAVKKAEDSNATILRLYEAHGASVTTTIKLYDTPTNGELVSMMEDSVSTLTTQDNQLSLTFSPFEIQSVKVTF